MLHPELGQLQEKYDELVSSVESGHVTYEDAVNILSSMVALDASGFEWRIDVDGNFTKAFPGQQPIVVDPKTFSPSGVVTGSTAAPGGWGSGAPSNFESTDLSTPPFAVNPQGYDNSDYTGRSPSPLPTEDGGVKPGKVKIPNIDFGKKKTLIIVGVSVLVGVILLVISLGGRSSDDAAVLDQNVPAEVTEGGSSDEIVINEEDASGDAEVAEQEVTETEDLISLKRARSVVKTLRNGKIGKLNKHIPGSLGNKLEVTGFLDAAARYGAKVAVTEIQSGGPGVSAIVIEITPKKNEDVSVWNLLVAKEDGTWVVQGTPTRVS